MADKHPIQTLKGFRETSAAFACAEMVRRAMKFAAQKDVRYYLNGVCIKPSKSGGVLVMASDGHTALVLHDAGGKADKTYILPFTKGRNDKGLADRSASYVAVSPAGEICALDINGRKRFICPEPLIEGSFPDIAKAAGDISEFECGIKGGFNPALMQRAIDSAGKGKFQSDIRFYSRKKDGEKSVLLFTTQHGFGLVMPMRDDATLSKKITKDFGGNL